MCYKHYDHYSLCSHGVPRFIECDFKRTNPDSDCPVESSGKNHDNEFCPRDACQQKNREIEEANERERRELEEEEERKSTKSSNSFRRKASVALHQAAEVIKRDLRGETPNPFKTSSKKSQPSLPALPEGSELVGYAYPLPAIVGRRSLPVKQRKDQEPFVGDIVKAYSAPVDSSTFVPQKWVDTTTTLQKSASILLRPHSEGEFEYVTTDCARKGSLVSTGSELHAQTYRDLIGKGPYDIDEEEPQPVRPGVYREQTMPERQPPYKESPSPPGNFRRGPSQSSTPRGSPPLEASDRIPSKSTQLRASTPPEPTRVPSQARKEPQIYHGQPEQREIIITKSGKRTSPTHSQEKLPRYGPHRQPTFKPKADDRMSIMTNITTLGDFIPNPLDNNVEARREGSKLADGTFDHRRLEQEKQRNMFKKQYKPSKLGSRNRIPPMQKQIAAKKFEEQDSSNKALQVVSDKQERPANVATAWPEPAKCQDEEKFPQMRRKKSPRMVFAERQASEERKRREAARPATSWSAGDESYFGPYSNQGGINQEVSPSSPYKQQLDHRSSRRTSPNYQADAQRQSGRRHSPRKSSPPSTSKQLSTLQRISSHNQVDTQRRGRRSPQNSSPPRKGTSKQFSTLQETSSDNQVDKPRRGRRSPQNSSPPRKDTAKQLLSIPERTSSDNQVDTQRRGRHSPQRSSPPRNHTSKQPSSPQRSFLNNQVDKPRRGKRSPRNSSPKRTNSSEQVRVPQRTSLNNEQDTQRRKHSPNSLNPNRTNSIRKQVAVPVPQRQNSYSHINWGQESYIDREAAIRACEAAEREQENIKRTAERLMEEKREEERRAAEEVERIQREIQAEAQRKKEARERKAALEKLEREREEQAEMRRKAVEERREAEAAVRKEAEEVEALRRADLSAFHMRNQRYSMDWPPRSHPDDKGRPYTMDHDGNPLKTTPE